MNPPALTSMTRVEIVVNGEDVPAVTDALGACGATGYTVLAATGGLGHHGPHQSGLHFNDRDGLRMVLCVVPDERAEAVIGSLRALLDDRPGVLFVSTTLVSRPEYFT